MPEMELDFYTKAEVDEKFSTTISSDTGLDFYTKAEIEANIGTPETIIIDGFDLDFYTKAEIDSIVTEETYYYTVNSPEVRNRMRLSGSVGLNNPLILMLNATNLNDRGYIIPIEPYTYYTISTATAHDRAGAFVTNIEPNFYMSTYRPDIYHSYDGHKSYATGGADDAGPINDFQIFSGNNNFLTLSLTTSGNLPTVTLTKSATRRPATLSENVFTEEFAALYIGNGVLHFQTTWNAYGSGPKWGVVVKVKPNTDYVIKTWDTHNQSTIGFYASMPTDGVTLNSVISPTVSELMAGYAVNTGDNEYIVMYLNSVTLSQNNIPRLTITEGTTIPTAYIDGRY